MFEADDPGDLDEPRHYAQYFAPRGDEAIPLCYDRMEPLPADALWTVVPERVTCVECARRLAARATGATETTA